MAIIVEHDKRRKEILEKSLEVFASEGYEDVTFQKIADRCGITRTTLYIYFKNKREIFLGSLKQVLSEMEFSIKEIVSDGTLTAEQALRKMSDIIVDYCEQNIKMFSVLLDYLLQLKKTGADTNEKVRRRVLKLRHMTTTLIIKGTQNGEFKNVNVHDVNELIYGLVESTLFRIAVLNQADMSEIRKMLNLAIDGLLAK